MVLVFFYDVLFSIFFFFSSRRRHTRYIGDWSSDVCSSDLARPWSIRGTPAHHRPGTRWPRGMGAWTARARSEERRVGKECRSRWSGDDEKKKGREGSGVSNSCMKMQSNDVGEGATSEEGAE